jgi:hypothetical protein
MVFGQVVRKSNHYLSEFEIYAHYSNPILRGKQTDIGVMVSGQLVRKPDGAIRDSFCKFDARC